MTGNTWRCLFLLVVCLAIAGCHHCGYGPPCDSGGSGYRGEPPYDRPFPIGAVTDAHWETQQTNAEAADFIFYDHEFVSDTARLAPGAKRHLEEAALRLSHVPFPVVIEQSPHNARIELDRTRRRTIVEALARMGHPNAEHRVIIAPAFPEGYAAGEAISAYYNLLDGGFAEGGGTGRRFGGRGGFFR